VSVSRRDIDPWLQGYACAVALLVTGWGQTGIARMMMEKEHGLTLEEFKRAGVDPQDLRALRKAFRDG
jgi:hypothetical protein